jgi:hypothetical protein
VNEKIERAHKNYENNRQNFKYSSMCKLKSTLIYPTSQQ